MPRPPCCRRIDGRPVAPVFKPAGVRWVELENVGMTLDEYEAIRLADLEGLYQQDAAERMEVSRATFGRILESAHRKLADVLVHGKALRIEGGPVRTGGGRPRGGQGRARCCRRDERRGGGRKASRRSASSHE